MFSCILDAEVVAYDRCCVPYDMLLVIMSSILNKLNHCVFPYHCGPIYAYLRLNLTTLYWYVPKIATYCREQKCLLPFQVLSTRKRKVEAGEEDSQKVKVILQIFDLLYINGKSLLREPLRARRALMQASFNHTGATLDIMCLM